MNKITLHNTRIINWGLITDSAYTRKDKNSSELIIDTSDQNHLDSELQLIVAANGVGKSTYADAILYNITGTTKFNSSADPNTGDNHDQRKLSSYSRGQHDNYINRPPEDDTWSKFLSFIALDWKIPTPTGHKFITTLTVLETNSQQLGTKSYWYILDDCKTTDLQFYQKDNSYFETNVQFRKANNIDKTQCMNKSTYITQLINILHLNTNRNEFNDFTNVLRAGYAAKTNEKINDFVYKYILSSNIDDTQIDNLISAFDTTNKINKDIDTTKSRKQAINYVLNTAKNGGLKSIVETAKYQQKKILYDAHRQKNETNNELKNQTINLQNIEQSIQTIKQQLKNKQNTIDQLQKDYNKTEYERNNASNSINQAITNYNLANNQFQNAQKDYNIINNQIQKIDSSLSVETSNLNQKLKNIQTENQNQQTIYQNKISDLDTLIKNKQKEINDNTTYMNALEKGQYPTDNPSVKFKQHLLQTYSDIDSHHVHLIADFIQENTQDDKWKQIIEHMIKPHESIIYIDDDSTFKLAKNELSKYNHDHIRLLNKTTIKTDQQKHQTKQVLPDNSLLSLIDITNPYVRYYLQSKLGKYQIFENDNQIDTKHQQYTISKNGLITDRFTTSKLKIDPKFKSLITFNNSNDAPTKINALKLENQQHKQKLQKFKTQKDNYFSQLKYCTILTNQCDELLKNKLPDIPNIVDNYYLYKKNKETAEHELQDAKNDPSIKAKIQRLDNKLKSIEHDLENYKNDITQLNANLSQKTENKGSLIIQIKELKLKQQTIDNKFNNIKTKLINNNIWCEIDDDFFNKPLNTPQMYQPDLNKSIDQLYEYVIKPTNKINTAFNTNECEMNYIESKLQPILNHNNHVTNYIDIDIPSLNELIDHYNKLYNEYDLKLDKFKDNLNKTMKKQYDTNIKNLLDNVYLDVCHNRTLIKDINDKLHTMTNNSFNREFHLKDHKTNNQLYKNIYKIGHDIHKNPNIDLKSNKLYISIFKELITKIDQKSNLDDQSELHAELKTIFDCRNYCTYSFQSRKANSNDRWNNVTGGNTQSGGENQIPLLLLVTLALTRFYDDQKPDTINQYQVSPRIIILDEAFNKSDAKNIEFILNAFKQSNLQAIIIAPNSSNLNLKNKHHSIMELIKNENINDQTKTFTWMNNIHKNQ